MARKESLMPTSTLVCQSPLRIEFTPGKMDEARCVYAAYATGRRSTSPCFTGMVHAAARLTCMGGRFVPFPKSTTPGPISASPARAAA